MAELKRKAISPQYAASIRSRMVSPIEMWLRCSLVEGAKMSISRWNSNHHKGAVQSTESNVA